MDDNSEEELKPAVSFPGQRTYSISYDKLVVAVGCGTATFGIEGAAAHSFMLKDADDAQKIRSRIIECFELASQPTLSDEERRGILHFAVVGGGPTGAQIRDPWTWQRLTFVHVLSRRRVRRRVARLFDSRPRGGISGSASGSPHVRRLRSLSDRDSRTSTRADRPFPVSSTIYDVAPGVLQGFDKSLSEFAAEKFKRQGVAVKGESHITRVHEGHLEIKEEGNVPFGMLVWATGLEANPFINSIKELKKDEKTHVCVYHICTESRRAKAHSQLSPFRLRITNRLNVISEKDQVYEDVFCLGDCSALEKKAPPTGQSECEKKVGRTFSDCGETDRDTGLCSGVSTS